MDSELRKRRVLRRAIVGVRDRISNLCKTEVAPSVVSQVQCELEEFQRLRSDFDELQERIFSLLPPDSENAETEEAEWLKESDEVRVSYTVAAGQVRSYVGYAERPSNRGSAIGSPLKADPGPARVRLPKIEIPKFDGGVRNWTSFKNLFRHLVHEDNNLSSTQKLYYLKTSVQGEAAELIRDFEISESSYVEAWSTMVTRYDNNRALIRTHLRDLFSIRKLKDERHIRKLVDDTTKILRALKALGENIEQWSTMLSYWISSCLDDETEKDWERSVSDMTRYPSYDSLMTFLNNRASSIECSWDARVKSDRSCNREEALRRNFDAKFSKTFATAYVKCWLCKESHFLENCDHFKGKSPAERYEVVKDHNLCIGCFSQRHNVADCKFGRCNQCKNRHHTLLHRNEVGHTPDRGSPTIEAPFANKQSLAGLSASSADANVLLPTAVVQTVGKYGKRKNTRILLDCASQITLVTESFVKRAKLSCYRSTNNVSGIGEGNIKSDYACTMTLHSRVSDFQITVEAAVTCRIPYVAPEVPGSNSHRRKAAEMKFRNGEVDLLLGAEYYERCMCNESDASGQPEKRRTHFGWVTCGRNAPSLPIQTRYCSLIINDLLTKFWELESVPNEKGTISCEQNDCVEFFEKTHRRAEDGRFVIKLPFSRDRSDIGESRKRAQSCLLRFERMSNSKVRDDYVKFMREYAQLGHMELVGSPSGGHVYYLPHHAVVKQTSSTTPTRVVFNASAKSSSGWSLNDCLMTGPSIQSDLFDIVIRFRCYAVAFTCDIQKMYRQILVDKDDRDMQRILWREKPNDDVHEFRLKTLTYGTVPASFIATKCLAMLASEIETSYPVAAQAIRENFYMDDLLCGADSVENAKHLQGIIHDVLATGCFPLRKYMSNSSEFLRSLSEDIVEKQSNEFELSEGTCAYVLGMIWCPTTDKLKIRIKLEDELNVLTKRIMLSEISRVFDPLGILSPVTIRGKILMQSLWKQDLNWDDHVIGDLRQQYLSYRQELRNVGSFAISRPYSEIRPRGNLMLYGFSDASELAYAAVIYLATFNENGNLDSSIVCARTRVAPVKALTVPRLELCGAVLLAELITRVRRILNVPRNDVRTFADSNVILGWLRSAAPQKEVFVKNRVVRINELVPCNQWAYVNTNENPADLATRGIKASKLLNSTLWVAGPQHLFTRNDSNKICGVVSVGIERNVVGPPVGRENLAENISSYTRLVNSVAYALRFIHNCKSVKKYRRSGPLEVEELEKSITEVIKNIQARWFQDDIERLLAGKYVSTKSRLTALFPVLDDQKVLRVGGRLENAGLTFARRHPIILPSQDGFVKLLARHVHLKYFHAGSRFVLNFIRQVYWIVGGLRRIVKTMVHGCVKCKRIAASTKQQLMGQLPGERVNVSRPFSHVGVDFAGPFETKNVVVRTTKFFKSYIAIFVCLAVKAVHIEMVSDLSTAAFLAAFRRFAARRGIPSVVYSDNATNFIGFQRFLEENKEEFKTYLTAEGIKWKFITPRAPHQGGIWEAAVKTAKHCLKKTIGNQVCTFEEYATLFAQIESCMNSRPLYSSLVNEEVVTPGHFLTGSNLIMLPDARDSKLYVGVGKRWHVVQQLMKAFWSRWRNDYLSELQTRNKWRRPTTGIVDGDVVIVKEDNVEPCKWPLARVLETLSGADGYVRKVRLRTATGIISRPSGRLIPLEVGHEPPQGGEC